MRFEVNFIVNASLPPNPTEPVGDEIRGKIIEALVQDFPELMDTLVVTPIPIKE